MSDSSSSSSTSSSSSGSRSPSPVNARPPPRNDLRAGSYSPPPGFQTAFFPHALADTGEIEGKEIWLFKIPPNVRPADLDGLQIAIPPADSSVSPKPYVLGSAKLALGALDDQSSADERADIELRLSKSEQATSEPLPDADAESQLTLMAASGAALSRSSTGDHAYSASDLHGPKLLLPVAEASYRGLKRHLKISQVPITHHVHLAIVPPSADAPDASSFKAPSGRVKRKREQPWAKLNGYFNPLGASTEEVRNQGRIDRSEQPLRTKKKKVEVAKESEVVSDDADRKERKARKKKAKEEKRKEKRDKKDKAK